MASFNIYHKDGSPLKDSNGKDITAHSLEYNGTWMGECFVSITFENEAPIDFSIGDYVMYREERFEINYDPGKIKCASKDTYGGAFRYESVKFNSLSDELVRCDMLDLVLYDNNIHYTALPQFTFYIESIDDLLDRIQANLDELYGKAAWKLYSRNKERSIQRGGTAEGWDEVYGEGTPDNVIDSTSIQISDQNCWEALSLVNSQFDINFIIRNRNVYVGTAGLPTANIFKYGKDKGLYEIEQNSESDQAIVTRLRAYGSNRNLPSHYYADLGSIPFLNITGDYHEGSTDNGLSVMMEDSLYSGMFTNVISDNGSNLKHCSVRGRIDGYEFDGELELVKKDALKSTTRLLVEVKAVSDAIKSKIDMGFVQVDFLKGANKSKFAGNRINYISNLPNNMACDRLMLPGFPNESLSEWWGRQTEEKKAWLNPGGKSHVFSTNKYRPYVDSLNIESIGIRPSSAFFDQEDKTNGIIEIYPTIEEMEVDGVRVDEIYRGTMVYDDGRFGDGETVENIDIYLSPSINFDINELKQDGFSISMKDGMCAGRTFKVASSRKMEDGSWRLTIEREKDDSIGLYFPYKDFQINKGDHFVLVDIEMPDAYVDAASEKLLKYCIAYLDKNDYTRYVYQPKVDEIFMARQHDKAMADESGLTKSLYLNIKEGDIMLFNDEDLGIDAEITIDQLTIKEEDGKIPTYEIVLREEKEVGTIQKIQNQISSIQNGNGGTAAGGSYSTTQIKDIVDAVGSEKFLSKINSDTAQGLITFIKGLVAEGRITANEGIRIGDFVAGFIGGMGGMIDKDGNAELKSLRLREFLEVPELRNNRIDVVSGELWNSICFGTIESVDVKRRIAVLKLQDGELSGIKAGDICRGIFHCLEADNPSESKEDECGFLQLAGFATSYFTPTEVYDNGASFKYTLRSGTSVHPQVGMKFAVYGSFTDKLRRASAYMTRTYTRYLNNVDTWQIRPDVHIYGQQGDIEGLTINGVEMHGYGAYLHNLYLSGVHIEFDRDWIDHNIPKTYNVVLTTYERTVVTDIEGNPLTGLEEIRNIISEDGNVVSGESNVIANRLALTTTIQASKGSTPLLYSNIMDEGRFVVSLQCIGCTAKCENGVVMVTSLDMESMEHQVVIEVNCEGEAVYQQIFNVPVVKQGENGVTADLDNEMATIAANDKGKPIVEPFEEIISHGRLWYGNDEMYLVKAEVAVPGGITIADVTKVTDEEGQHIYLPIVDNKYCTLRITDVGEDAADISQIRIELFGRIKEQMNTEYSKVVVFTLNKVRMGENAQNYSLLTTSPIMQADGKGNVTTTQVACSVLASDGKTMTELTTADELKEHTLTMKVQLYNAHDAVSEDVAYTIGTNLVVGTSTIGGLKLTKDSVRLVFSLYWQGLLIDKEGIPMIKDGSSTVRIDLDNENDSILYNDAGEKVSSDCYTNIKVYDGSKNVTSSCTLSIDYRSSVSAYISGTQCYVTSITSTTGYARIAAYYPADGNTYYAIFSIKRLVGEDKYEIVTSPTTVSYDPNKKEYSATSVKVDVYRTDQNGVRSIISSSNTLPSGYALQYSTDGSVWAAISAGSSVTPDYTTPTIYLRIVDNNGKVRDSETVPVVIGGSDSTSYWLISPVSAFSLSPSGSYTPSSFTVTMKKKKGEGEVDNCSDFYLSVWGVLSGGGVDYISRNSEKSYSITVAQPSSSKSYTSLMVVASSDVPSSNNYPSKIVAELGIGIVTDGKPGDAGNSIFLIDKGIFKTGQSYKFDKMEGVTNAYERDWVLHNPGGGSYYAYAVKTMGTKDLQTAPSIAGASDSNWEFLNKHESVLADTLIGVNCNIGGFAVTSEQFASQTYLTNNAGICINGKNGEIIAKQSSTSEWKVDTSGNMSIGNPSGQRIVVNPETKDIKVFDSSDNLVTTISGVTVSSISNLFGSAGTINAVSSAVGFTKRGSGSIVTKTEYITLSNQVYADAGAKLSASCSLYLSASPYYDTGDTSKPQIMGNSISVRIVYTDYYNVVQGAITGNFSMMGDVLSGGAGSNTLRGSAIVKSSGYYYVKLEVKYTIGASNLNLVVISNITPSGLSLVVNNYLSRLLANGFCFGSTNANYIAALNESDGNMHFDFKAGTTQLELTNSNFVLKSQYGKVFPTILWVYCSYSAISSYFTATGIKPTFTKSSTGSYVIDYSACNLGTLSAGNTILSVTSVYGEYRAIQIGNISTGKFPILSFDKSGNAADTYFILQVQRII